MGICGSVRGQASNSEWEMEASGGGGFLRWEGSRWRPAFIVAAACKETEADRGEPAGDSERGSDEASPLAAIMAASAQRLWGKAAWRSGRRGGAGGPGLLAPSRPRRMVMSREGSSLKKPVSGKDGWLEICRSEGVGCCAGQRA